MPRVSTSRRIDSISSNSGWPMISGGASCTTGSPRSSEPLGLRVVEGLLGGLVLDQLDPVEVAGPAHVTDDRQVQQLLQSCAERALVGLNVGVEAFTLEDVEVGQRSSRRHRVTTPGVAVQERRRALLERLEQPVVDHHRAHRGVPGGQALGERDDVRLDAVPVHREVVADAAHGADGLVGDEQHVVLVADLAHPLEVAGRRREAAAGVLHGLEEHRRHALGALELDGLGDAVGSPPAERRDVVGVSLGPVEVGVRHLVGTGNQRFEGGLRDRDPGDRQSALGGAVVGDIAADHLVLGGLARELVVLLGQLPRRLDGLAATAGEEGAVDVRRGQLPEAVGQLDRRRVRVGPQREERECLGLLGHRLGDLLATVTGLHGEQPSEAVEVGPALVVPDPRTLAADDDGHVAGTLLVDRVPREVHPEPVPGPVGQGVVAGLGEGHLADRHRVPQV